MQKNIFQKIWPIIKKYKVLRTLGVLSIIFIIFVGIFFTIGLAYGNKIEANKNEVAKNEQELVTLQKLILDTQNKKEVDINLFQNKSFADFDEVVPFIALLEKIFEKVDPESQIVIKSQEDQIFVDHFADYSISVSIEDKDLFFDALKELYDSRFITKVMSFSMQYKADESGLLNQFSEAEFIIRLYLK